MAKKKKQSTKKDVPPAIQTDLSYYQLLPFLALFDGFFPGAKKLAGFEAIIADGLITNAEIDERLDALGRLRNAALEDAHENERGNTADTAHDWTVDATSRLFDATQALLYLLRALPDDARIKSQEAQNEG